MYYMKNHPDGRIKMRSFFLYTTISQTDIWRVKFEGKFFMERFEPVPVTLEGIIFFS